MTDDLKQRLRSNFPTTQAQFEAADRIEQLEAEVERLKTTPAYKREDLHCVVSDLCEQVREAEAERDELKAALENCRLLAARNRHGDWAQHILRFCLSVGISATPLREAATAKGEK